MNLKSIVFAALVGVFLSSCPNQNSDPINTSPRYSNDLWGEWWGLRKGSDGSSISTWYISSNKVEAKKPGAASYFDYTKYVALTKESENVIRIVESGKDTYMLYPKRTAKGSFSGNISSMNGSQQNHQSRLLARSAGWADELINIINKNDQNQRQSTKTDGNGDFTAGGAVPGDTYIVTADGKSVEVTPQENGDNVGTITITNGLNFKASGLSTTEIMLSGGTSYNCTISIKNIGTVSASACTYQITGDEGESFDGIIGSIAPGAKKDINLLLSCGTFQEEKRFKKLNVVVVDTINNKSWNDSVSFQFYKGTITFTVMGDYKSGFSDAGVRGIVISPENKSYILSSYAQLLTSGIKVTSPLTVPRLTGTYIVGVVATSRETIYGIDSSIFSTHMSRTEFLNQAASFIATGNYEPNNTESGAKLISSPIISYFHTGDMDYYLVRIE
jgi:hypothetical protein